MKDQWGPQSAAMSDPAYSADAIEPDDDNDLTSLPKAIYVGTGGDLAMLGIHDTDDMEAIIFKNVPSGAIIPFRARRVKESDTTATDLLALY